MTSQSPGAASPKPAFTKTFYQRPLPDSCIAFTSTQGRALFASALKNQGLKSFYHLIQQHSTQAEPAYCGVSTLTIALNAFSMDPRRAWRETPWRWYDESLLNCCVPLEQVKQTGITIPTFACLAKCQGLRATVHYAQDGTVEEFRTAVRQACVEVDVEDDDTMSPTDNHDRSAIQLILVVSYHRGTLQQTGTGHFSPIAAYDEASDSVLILDTARFKYGVHWVSLPLLFQAMQPIDPDTNKSRGYVLLKNEQSNDQHFESLPVSILLRSTMKQAPVRKEYKHYLTQRNHQQEESISFERSAATSTSSTITWEAVWRYWTRNLTDSSYVWNMTQPSHIPAPHETELIDLIAQVRALIQMLLPPKTNEQLLRLSGEGCCSCGFHDQRTLDLQPDEVIFMVYLASLPEEDRTSMVMATDVEATEAARKQLLDEAQLLAFAIEMGEMSEEEVKP